MQGYKHKNSRFRLHQKYSNFTSFSSEAVLMQTLKQFTFDQQLHNMFLGKIKDIFYLIFINGPLSLYKIDNSKTTKNECLFDKQQL